MGGLFLVRVKGGWLGGRSCLEREQRDCWREVTTEKGVGVQACPSFSLCTSLSANMCLLIGPQYCNVFLQGRYDGNVTTVSLEVKVHDDAFGLLFLLSVSVQ